MQDVILSLNKNLVKLTTVEKEGLNSLNAEVSHAIVSDTKILNVNDFTLVIDGLLTQLSSQKRTNLRMHVVLEPQDVVLKFVTVNKKNGELDAQIIEEIKTKLDGFVLEEMYFTYQKIAPFVYQFIGVPKAILDDYIAVANLLRVSLATVLPWVLLLPKYVGTNETAIFISKVDDDQTVALSELGGIFFAGVYKEEKTSTELQAIVQELSVYKRTKPIDKIYTLNYETFSLSDGYDVHKIDIPNSDVEGGKGYEINLLVNYMLDFVPDLPSTHYNLLNTLPLPVVEKKALSLVHVGAALGIVIGISILSAGLIFWRKNNPPVSADLAGTNIVTPPTVLSENTDKPKETTSTPDTPQADQLKKEDLVIRVENAANINGMAGKTRTFLEGLSYKVLEIDTADETEANTIVKFKPAKIAYKDMLLKDLDEKFPSITTEETVEASAEYDVLILVGESVKLE